MTVNVGDKVWYWVYGNDAGIEATVTALGLGWVNLSYAGGSATSVPFVDGASPPAGRVAFATDGDHLPDWDKLNASPTAPGAGDANAVGGPAADDGN